MASTSALKTDAISGWSLYWVSSYGPEDCFVVAKNSRSAKKLECDMNGFDREDVTVYRVKSIPIPVTNTYFKQHRKRELPAWPWYADEWLLKKLGAKFRDIDDLQETLIESRVYRHGCAPKSIGQRFLKEFRREQDLYPDEELFDLEEDGELFMMLGMCLTRCQQIEFYISQSFILAPSFKKKKRQGTIADLIKSWERKTLGQLLKIIEESYEIEPTVKASLAQFLSMRNEFVHGITTRPRYDIRTEWGRDELIAFLVFFEALSRLVRRTFRATYYATIDYGVTHLLDKVPRELRLTKKQKAEIALFVHCFQLRGAGISA